MDVENGQVEGRIPCHFVILYKRKTEKAVVVVGLEGGVSSHKKDGTQKQKPAMKIMRTLNTGYVRR